MKRNLLTLAIIFYGSGLFSATLEVPAVYTTIQAAVTAAAEGDIINIAAGPYNTTAGVFTSVTDKSLTFNGAGRGVTIINCTTTPFGGTSGNRVGIIIGAITASRTVNIQNLTIQNSFTTVSGGGGIRVTSGLTSKLTLNVTNVEFLNNYTVGNSNIYGGGMYLSGIIDATLTNCSFTGNKNTGTAAGAGGGAIFVASSAVSLVIDRCNISGNTAGGKGGGAILSGIAGGAATGPLNIKIKNSTLSSNTTTYLADNTANGAAIKILCGANGATAMEHSLWIENSTIYGNTTPVANRNGGGIYFESAASGQAVDPTQTITLNHCTVVNNTTASGTGGDGVCISSASGYPVTLVMNNSIVMNNSGSTVNQSQIGQDNTAATDKIINGGITNSIFKIIADGTWVTTANNNNLSATVEDLAFAEALSADATPVLITGPTSVARNYVTTNSLIPALSTDQLGNARVQNTDAGAWENQEPAVLSHNPSFDIESFNLSVVNDGLLLRNISENSTIRVFDIIGKMVANKISNGNAIEINLNSKGIYTIVIDNGTKTKTIKVIY